MSEINPEPARRGRPRLSTEQAERSRRLIIESARKLFLEEGYHGVSMRKIASLAGCSPAALYKLFPGKRQVLLHIWEEVFSALIDELNACYHSRPSSERLGAICLAFIDFWLSRPDDYRAIFLIEDQPQSDKESYFADSSGVENVLKILRQAIEESQKRGEIAAGDPDEKKNVLLCGIQGVAMNLITIPEYPWGDPDVIKRTTVGVLLAGLK